MNKKEGTYALITLLILALGVLSYLISITFFPIPTTSQALFYALGRFCGLFGFFSLATLIISGDSARYIDRFFGMDQIIKFQRKFSFVATALLLFHPIFFMLSAKSTLPLTNAFATISLAAGAFGFMILLLIMICSVLYKRISQTLWQYLHILTYILFFLGLYHAFFTGSDAHLLRLQLLYLITLALFISAMIYRTWYKIYRRPVVCTLIDTLQETNDTFTLVVEPQKPISFAPGQFFFIKINKNKLYARHPFSIASAPHEKLLKITIKESGRFTATAKTLKKGEKMTLEGPFGTFVAPKEGDLVFIAGGVGITPIISMLRHFIHTKNTQNVTLLYGSKTEKEIIAKKEIDSMKKEWLNVVHILSREEKTGYETGRISKEILQKYIKKPQEKTYYICGPELMKDQVLVALKELGVKKNQIKFESFFW